jgi:hypothetical protein
MISLLVSDFGKISVSVPSIPVAVLVLGHYLYEPMWNVLCHAMDKYSLLMLQKHYCKSLLLLQHCCLLAGKGLGSKVSILVVVVF